VFYNTGSGVIDTVSYMFLFFRLRLILEHTIIARKPERKKYKMRKRNKIFYIIEYYRCI